MSKTELERIEIKEFKTMNGRQVPIYKIIRYTKEDVEIANRIAAEALEKELGKPSSFNDVVKILHEHAEEVKKEGLPDTQETPAQTQEESNGQDSCNGNGEGTGERISQDAPKKP